MKKRLIPLLLVMTMLLAGCTTNVQPVTTSEETTSYTEESAAEMSVIEDVTTSEDESSAPESTEESVVIDMGRLDIPEFAGSPYIDLPFNEELNEHWNDFQDSNIILSDWDELGRCGQAIMLASKDTMPTGERGSTGQAKPSGWHQNKYPGVVNSEPPYLYNRAHLLMWALSGLTDNRQNLITGTRYFNVEGMLPTETEVVRYVESSGEKVLYRVTPIFTGDNLLADGVVMEAVSESGTFRICRYAYNVQPGVQIDYATGENWLVDTQEGIEVGDVTATEPGIVVLPPVQMTKYVLNTNSMKIHTPSCESVQDMNPNNMEEYVGSMEDLMAQGYEPCGRCHPQ